MFDTRTALRDTGVSEMVKFEVFTMAKTNGHPNVLELLDMLASPTKIFVVIESVSGSCKDLFDAIVSEGRQVEILIRMMILHSTATDCSWSR